MPPAASFRRLHTSAGSPDRRGRGRRERQAARRLLRPLPRPSGMPRPDGPGLEVLPTRSSRFESVSCKEEQI